MRLTAAETLGWLAVLALASGALGALLQRWWTAVEWTEQTSCAACRRPVWRCRCGGGSREAAGRRHPAGGVTG